MFVSVATMFPGDKSTPSKVHFPFEWCKIYKEHILAGCFRLTGTSAADSRPVLEGMADGMKYSVVREGVGLELLLLLQNERLQMRWPGHWVRISPRCPPAMCYFWHVPQRRMMTPRRAPGWMRGWIITCSLLKQKIIHQPHNSSL